MTVTAVGMMVSPAPVRVPAVASLAVRGATSGTARRGRVLGTSTHAVWIAIARDVIVITTNDAARLPNGIEVPSGAARAWFEAVRHGDEAEVGSGRVVLDGLTVEIVRWWNPRPALPVSSPRAMCDRLAGLSSRVPGVPAGDLATAIEARDAAGLVAACGQLLGRGPGLTPEGDDYLAGAVAGVRCLAPVVQKRAPLTMLDAAEAPISVMASARTTSFSAALLRHAFAGRVAAPAGDLLRALAGRGDVDRAHRRLTAVGHTSGTALAAGIVLGANELIQGEDT